MLKQPYQLYFERTDRSQNMARFYHLAIEQTLFGTPSVIRRWGRIGTRGQSKIEHYGCEQEAVAAFLSLIGTRKSRGYRTIQVNQIRAGG